MAKTLTAINIFVLKICIRNVSLCDVEGQQGLPTKYKQHPVYKADRDCCSYCSSLKVYTQKADTLTASCVSWSPMTPNWRSSAPVTAWVRRQTRDPSERHTGCSWPQRAAYLNQTCSHHVRPPALSTSDISIELLVQNKIILCDITLKGDWDSRLKFNFSLQNNALELQFN